MIEDIPISQCIESDILAAPISINGNEHMSLPSRITMMADMFFGAITSDGVYKNRVTSIASIEMLKTACCDIFVTNVFITNLKRFKNYLIQVLFSNGKNGEFIYIPFDKLISPFIRTPCGYLKISANSSIKLASML